MHLTDSVLQKKQTEFVSLCIEHLLGASSKIILVGYSMGGLVVDRVLQEGRVNSHVLMSITIGSPHFHLPSFLIPEKSLQISAIRVHEVPTVHILSGPGDVQVPASSAWSAYASQNFDSNMTFEVDTDNIPGVWVTSSHKGLVSCNQLVRKIIPLLLDSIIMDSNGLASTMAIYQMMTRTLSSNTSLGIHKFSKEIVTWENRTARSDCMSVPDSVYLNTLKARDKHGPSCFSLHIGNSPSFGPLFQIAIHGLKPGREISIIGSDGGRYINIDTLLSPLPSLSITEPKENKRFWQDVIQGIDWMQNSTWIAEIDMESLHKVGAKTLDILLEKEEFFVEGQSFSVVLTTKEERTVYDQGVTFQNHTLVEIDLQRMFNNYFGILSKTLGPLSSWRYLAWALPLRLVLETKRCLGVSGNQNITPLFISKSSSQHHPGDYLWKDLKHNTFGMPLWHPSSVSDSVFLVVDPSCQHSISIQHDILSAVSYSIRYQVYALPGLLLASSIMRLVPVVRRGVKFVPEYPSLKSYGGYCLGVTAQAIVLSNLLHVWQAGSVPWLFLLTPFGLLSILWTCFCLDLLIKSVCCVSFNVATWVLPRRVNIPNSRWELLSTLLMLLSCIFHDFLPFYVSLLFIFAFRRHLSSHVMDFSPVEWYLILLYGVGPMVIAMSGGKIIGYSGREKYGISSLERLLLLFISLASIQRKRFSLQRPWKRAARALLSQVAVFASLFGLNFIPPFVVAMLCLGEMPYLI